MVAAIADEGPQPGDLLFVHGTGLVSWLIRRGTGSAYCHVRLSVGNGRVIESMPPGVQAGWVRKEDVRLRLPYLTSEDRAVLVRAAWADVGVVRYSRLSFVGDALHYLFGWHLTIDSDTAFNCAEWCAFRLGHIDYRNISPGGLYAQCVAQGAHL